VKKILASKYNRRVPMPRNRMRGLADYDMTFCPSETPADGFSMNAALRYLPYRSFSLYLGQLDELRCCRGSYRNRDFVIPFDVEITIEAFGTLKYQQQMHPGTIIWGFNFSALDEEVSLSDFTVQIKDLCKTYQFFYGDGTDAIALRPTVAANLFPVLCEPYVVEKAPGATGGLIDVTIGNKTNADQSCQLVIRTAEPCAVMGGGMSRMPGDLPLPGTPVQQLPIPGGGGF
jgi:hypothetical protein